ncbi:hypothetical protein PR003_g19579 [Phytophthora rubi]|uniref:Uncharacterized protein n=1 Tax=Phytophthora rubi TaxID=129364 RepID=A0A6A4E489_9STRA|nr:hypothetical protein PR003_g19579 [Phytophthora rubi]
MKETRTVGVSKTVGAGAETKKAVERVAVQEEVIEYEASDDPRTEESAVLEAEADAPEEAVNKVIVGDDLAVVNRHVGREHVLEYFDGFVSACLLPNSVMAFANRTRNRILSGGNFLECVAHLVPCRFFAS